MLAGGQFRYVSNVETLYWDADGAGAAASILFLALSGNPMFSATDIFIF